MHGTPGAPNGSWTKSARWRADNVHDLQAQAQAQAPLAGALARDRGGQAAEPAPVSGPGPGPSPVVNAHHPDW